MSSIFHPLTLKCVYNTPYGRLKLKRGSAELRVNQGLLSRKYAFHVHNKYPLGDGRETRSVPYYFSN